MSDYLANVKKYIPDADEAVVDKLVKHLGIALQKKDSSTVAASDQQELDRVRNGFCTKKLELSADDATKAIEATCATMKGDNSKCRVAFYYLVAKESGALDKIA